MSSICVYMLEQKPEICRAMKQFCDNQMEFQFLGAASDTNLAMEELSQLRPHIILISLSFPDLERQFIVHMKELFPKARIITYDFADDVAYRVAAMSLGIENFVSTPNLITELQMWAANKASLDNG